MSLLFNKPASGLLNKMSHFAAALGVTKIISKIIINLVTPKAGAKREPLFNKLMPVC
jgi:hypothetical protein